VDLFLSVQVQATAELVVAYLLLRAATLQLEVLVANCLCPLKALLLLQAALAQQVAVGRCRFMLGVVITVGLLAFVALESIQLVLK
jgi:hypothetical protein